MRKFVNSLILATVGIVATSATLFGCMYLLDYRESCGIESHEDPTWEILWVLIITAIVGYLSVSVTSSLINKNK